MAKFLPLFLLTLALVAASNAGAVSAAAAADDNGDLAQRLEAMAEAVRIFSNPVLAAAADSETVGRVASFFKREIGPLGAVFDAIGKMPVKTAAEIRSKEEASDAAHELLMRHFMPLMPKQGCPHCRKSDDDL